MYSCHVYVREVSILNLLFVFVGLVLSDEEKKKYALQEIEKLLRRNGDSLERLTKMPQVSESSENDSNVLILDERSYPREALLETLERYSPKMTDEQRKIFDEIIDAAQKEEEGLFLSMGLVGLVKLSFGNYYQQLLDLKAILFLMLHRVELLRYCYLVVGQVILDLGYL